MIESSRKAFGAKKLTRAERGDLTRRALIVSAADVVGKFGYAEASIARICDQAGVGLGTFYNYFDARQELLDLLPIYYGDVMLEYIRSRMSEGDTAIEREVKRLENFLQFFRENAAGARLVNEAPIMAPDGYVKFYKMVRAGYTRAIERGIASQEIVVMSTKEISVLVDMLIAIRSGLSQQLLVRTENTDQDTETILKMYRDIVARAFCRQS